VIHARAELDPIVATRIAHDDVVVTEHPGKRVEAGGGFVVRRHFLADLDRAPVLPGEA
jgi:hypothetical protein